MKIKFKILILFTIFTASTIVFAKDNKIVTIVSPLNKTSVPIRPVVKGILNIKAKIWVVVHPLSTNEYWVQPSVSIQKIKWQTKIYIGREGNIDVGKQFEIRAVVNPFDSLQEGMKFNVWPKAQAYSNIKTVTRK